jgi:hypothetical protein
MMDLSIHLYDKVKVESNILTVSNKPVPIFKVRQDGSEATYFFNEDETITDMIKELQKLKRALKKRRAQENDVPTV